MDIELHIQVSIYATDSGKIQLYAVVLLCQYFRKRVSFADVARKAIYTFSNMLACARISFFFSGRIEKTRMFLQASKMSTCEESFRKIKIDETD